MRMQKIENAAGCLKFLQSKGVKLVAVGAEDLVDGNRKLLLGLLWSVFLRFQITGIIEPELSKDSPKLALLLWCNKQIEFAGLKVENFGAHWKDGLALNALLNRDGFEDAKQTTTTQTSRFELALQAAKQRNLPCVLDAADFVNDVDEISMMIFLTQIFHAKLKEKPSSSSLSSVVEESAPPTAPPSSTTAGQDANTLIVVRPSPSRKHSIQQDSTTATTTVLATAHATNDFFGDVDDELSLLTGDKLEIVAFLEDPEW